MLRQTSTHKGCSVWSSDLLSRARVFQEKICLSKAAGGLKVMHLISWNRAAILKHSWAIAETLFIVWLAVQRRFATVVRLLNFAIQVPASCVFRDMADETLDNLFFSCSVTGSLWQRLGMGSHYLEGQKQNQVSRRVTMLTGFCRNIAIHIHIRGTELKHCQAVLGNLNAIP
ncbi:hypothetical protein MTR67_029984 [Solanum verrucosum]|uniref:Reverse transcriptase zinc-binding domain-containing protein n=1 Tax=Solanum verrucosum TaxID=315347 RepID=A0AAF0R594_SOLVR|nr:hypothetical protein MTR67_029984 [Solanum verrucosum]